MRRLLLVVLALVPLALCAQTYRSDEHAFRLVVAADNLEYPWSLAFLPDGRMLITEKRGRLLLLSADGKSRREIGGVPEVAVHGQGGLLEVALHPQFGKNQLVYLSYSARGEDGVGTELARGRLAGERLENVQVLFRQGPKGTRGQHFGGKIVFDRAGFVYLTLGDRGEMPRAQRPDDHAGSVIRLHDDGRVPKDNPFAGKPNWKPEKLTLGHRNIQGAAFHPRSGELWTHEHGPQGGDEINIIKPGANYGWPVTTYGANYGSGTRIGEGTAKAGMEPPLHHWVPSIAPSGMAFYTGDKFPRWQNDLFVGALRDRMLVRLRVDGEKVVKEERLLRNVVGRIRDVRVGPDGFIYFLTDDSSGLLARLEPSQ